MFEHSKKERKEVFLIFLQFSNLLIKQVKKNFLCTISYSRVVSFFTLPIISKFVVRKLKKKQSDDIYFFLK